MAIYYLMVKTHNKTGLKYLCQTKRKDPYAYLGSGKDWKDHLTEYGEDIRTDVLLFTTKKTELNTFGRYYSKLFNVVGAMDDFGNKIYANKIPETGGGPGWKSGDDNPSRDPNVNAKIKSTLNTPFHKNKRSGKNNAMTHDDVKETMAKIRETPEHQEKFSQAMIEVNLRPSVKAAQRAARSGLKNSAADQTIYEFVHKDGRTEISTRYDLRMKYDLNRNQVTMVVLGICKSVKGWRLATSIPTSPVSTDTQHPCKTLYV